MGDLDPDTPEAAETDDRNLLAGTRIPVSQRRIQGDAGAQQRCGDIEIHTFGNGACTVVGIPPVCRRRRARCHPSAGGEHYVRICAHKRYDRRVPRLLRNVTFRHLYLAQIASLLGTGLMTVALGLLAYDLAGPRAGQVLGTALAIKMVAYVVMAPIMRATLARFPTVRVLVGADLIRLLMALGLPWVNEVWQIYVLVFALQSASATFTPTFASTIPVVVPDRDDYSRAQSASRIAYDLESVLSPMIAALLLGVVSYSTLFVGTGVGFAASALLVVTSGLRALDIGRPPDTAGDFWARTTSGLRIMLSHRLFRGLLAANVAVAAATAVVVVSSVVYVRSVLGLDDSALALALGVFGGGSIAVALALPVILRHVGTGPVIVIGAGLCTIALATTGVLLAVAPSTAGLLVIWAVAGAATSLINTASPQLIRDHTDDADRDDVFTAQFSTSHAAFLVTYPLAGWAPAVVGIWATPVLLAAVALTGAVGAYRVWRPARSTVSSAADDRVGVRLAGDALPG